MAEEHPGVIRVMVVDDDRIVREALSTYVERNDGMTVTAFGASGEEAINAARRGVDVVLMDVHMPGLGGLQATKLILERPDAPRVIMLTTFDEDEYLLAALAAGASGFLVKNIAPEALAQAIILAHAGGRILTGHASNRLAAELVPAVDQAAGHEASTLTEREREVLQALCEAASNAEIAQRLHLSQSTVKSYVSAVMLKLDCTSRLQTVVKAYELGLARPNRRAAHR